MRKLFFVIAIVTKVGLPTNFTTSVKTQESKYSNFATKSKNLEETNLALHIHQMKIHYGLFLKKAKPIFQYRKLKFRAIKHRPINKFSSTPKCLSTLFSIQLRNLHVLVMLLLSHFSWPDPHQIYCILLGIFREIKFKF